MNNNDYTVIDNKTGEPVKDEVFILNPIRDNFSFHSLNYYAQLIKNENPELAKEISQLLNRVEYKNHRRDGNDKFKRDTYEPVVVPFKIDPRLFSDIGDAINRMADYEFGKLNRWKNDGVSHLIGYEWKNKEMYKLGKLFHDFEPEY